jgi:N-acetyl-1-D-myo-inositol-2-amino-2-deoxy-alpha-D-glucopyranoside deacetylase
VSHRIQGLKVLFAFAHPDDEGFATGGTIAMLVNQGARVTLVCATNGDVGEISDPSLATPATLGQVRQEELRRAMDITGVQDIRFLNYRDSGMVDTADNHHPNALMQADPTHVVGQLVAIMRQTRPEVVITHDPTGGYGHPDHITMCQLATTAFGLAGDASAYPEPLSEAQAPWAPSLLYYVCFPRSVFRRMWQSMLDRGVTPPFASKEIDVLGTPDDEVTTVLDVGPFVDTKIASLNCHRTQIDPNGPFAQLPENLTRDIMRTEYYTLVLPAAAGPAAADVLAALSETGGSGASVPCIETKSGHC